MHAFARRSPIGAHCGPQRYVRLRHDLQQGSTAIRNTAQETHADTINGCGCVSRPTTCGESFYAFALCVALTRSYPTSLTGEVKKAFLLSFARETTNGNRTDHNTLDASQPVASTWTTGTLRRLRGKRKISSEYARGSSPFVRLPLPNLNCGFQAKPFKDQ